MYEQICIDKCVYTNVPTKMSQQKCPNRNVPTKMYRHLHRQLSRLRQGSGAPGALPKTIKNL